MGIGDIERAHTDVSTRLDVEVAPAGLAWLLSEKERPDLNLYADDVHPDAQGSYLAASVLYATIFKKSSVGLSYFGGEIDSGKGNGITLEKAGFLQRIAWQTVTKYKPANVHSLAKRLELKV